MHPPRPEPEEDALVSRHPLRWLGNRGERDKGMVMRTPQGAEWLPMLFIVGLIISLFVVPYFVAKSARDKGRSFGAWYAITAVLGVFLCFVGWIIAAIIVATMQPQGTNEAASPGSFLAPPSSPPPLDERSTPPSPAPSRPTKRCPACAEDILADARKCKHCGEELSQPGSPS